MEERDKLISELRLLGQEMHPEGCISFFRIGGF
jgi:hypothetical protein